MFENPTPETIRKMEIVEAAVEDLFTELPEITELFEERYKELTGKEMDYENHSLTDDNHNTYDQAHLDVVTTILTRMIEQYNEAR